MIEGSGKKRPGPLRTIAGWLFLLVLIPLVLVMIVFGAYALGEMAPAVALLGPVALLLEDLKRFRQKRSPHSPAYVAARLPFMPFVILAWMCPFVAFNHLWRTYLFEIEGELSVSGPFFLIRGDFLERLPPVTHLSAACALLFALWIVFSVARLMRRRIRLLEQTETLPLRELRPGPVELVGVARACGEGSGPILRRRVTEKERTPDEIERWVQPFFLEEGERRVRIDPGDAVFFDPSAEAAGREAAHFLLLTRRVVKEGKVTTATLEDGDRVYVFGTAVREAEGRWEIRPREHRARASFLDRLLFLVDREIVSRDPRHLFIVADGPEEKVHRLLRAKVVSAAWLSLIWVIPALLLLLTT